MERLPQSIDSKKTLAPDYRFVTPAMRNAIAKDVELLLQHGPLKQKLTALLTASADQQTLDVRQLLNMKWTPAESVAAVSILESVIDERWRKGQYIMQCDPSTIDLSDFNDLPIQDYEWMPTQVHPDSMWGGIGKLYLRFPAGLQEAETTHTHPGARIVVSTGRGKFTCEAVEDGWLHLDAGTVVLMPKNLPHNFSAYDDEDWRPISFHLPYAGIGKEAMEF